MEIMEKTALIEAINGVPGMDSYINLWARKRFAEFFRISPQQLIPFKFDGSLQDFSELGKAIQNNADIAENYYWTIIKLTFQAA